MRHYKIKRGYNPDINALISTYFNAEGDVEPCPFAPYSDMNLKNVSLKDALNSNFLKKIRENHAQLHETGGSCALWEKRDMVKSLLEETK